MKKSGTYFFNEKIGWIEFNCFNEKIGWIEFNCFNEKLGKYNLIFELQIFCIFKTHNLLLAIKLINFKFLAVFIIIFYKTAMSKN